VEFKDESNELNAIYCYISTMNRSSDYLQTAVLQACEGGNIDTQWYLATVQNDEV
jgi:hypothetical protein